MQWIGEEMRWDDRMEREACGRVLRTFPFISIHMMYLPIPFLSSITFPYHSILSIHVMEEAGDSTEACPSTGNNMERKESGRHWGLDMSFFSFGNCRHYESICLFSIHSISWTRDGVGRETNESRQDRRVKWERIMERGWTGPFRS